MARPDQSMSLLTDLQANALEPEYLEARSRRKVSPVVLGATLAVLAALIVVAGVSTTRTSSEADDERRDLLERISDTQTRVDAQASEAATLEQEIRTLGDAQVNDPALTAAKDSLDPLVGMIPVTGPGIIIEISDATDASGTDGMVFDSDLSRMVNGLRQAGAEAVSINGRRITALTPIRTAGTAITVDYVSLSPPYRVEAIGDPATLASRFARTGAAAWWKYISDNFGIGFTISESTDALVLPADPGMQLRYSEK